MPRFKICCQCSLSALPRRLELGYQSQFVASPPHPEISRQFQFPASPCHLEIDDHYQLLDRRVILKSTLNICLAVRLRPGAGGHCRLLKLSVCPGTWLSHRPSAQHRSPKSLLHTSSSNCHLFLIMDINTSSLVPSHLTVFVIWVAWSWAGVEFATAAGGIAGPDQVRRADGNLTA
jgi:hypothetical protein